MNYNFKRQHSFSNRQRESNQVLCSYPDRIPIICERSELASYDCPYIYKKKYLVPRNLTFGQFICVIRNKLRVPPDKGLFLSVNGVIPSSSYEMSVVYDFYKDIDGYLYVLYMFENIFG